LAHEEAVARWLWDQHVAAVATDSPALEVLPVDQTSMETFLPVRLIALLGLAIGEMFDLESARGRLRRRRGVRGIVYGGTVE
jgi:hypothetical protein